MKSTFIIFGSLLLLSCLFNACQPQIDVEAAKKSIIAVNEEERDAYFAKDIARLEKVWVQEPASKRYFSSERSLTILDGWAEIKADYQEDFEAEWWDDYEDVKADFSNYEIHVHGNSAIVYHDILWTGKHLGEPFESTQKRILFLVNLDGTWKMSFTAQLTVPEKTQDIEGEPAEEGQ